MIFNYQQHLQMPMLNFRYVIQSLTNTITYYVINSDLLYRIEPKRNLLLNFNESLPNQSYNILFETKPNLL